MAGSKATANTAETSSAPYREPYFRSLVARYRTRTDSQGKQIADPLIDKIIGETEDGEITWSQVFALELAMVRLYSARELSQRSVRLRNDLKSMVCPARYAAYEAQLRSSDCPDDCMKLKELREDTLYLLGELQRLRCGTNEFENIRSSVRLRYFWLVAIVASLSAGYWFCASYFNQFEWSDLPCMMLAGGLGAVFSVAIRMARIDPNDDVEVVLNTINSFRQRAVWLPLLSVIEGMIAAIVLYTLFVSKLLQGALFPLYNATQSTTHGTPTDVIAFFVMSHPEHRAGFALLLFWGFVGGFSERLVPDVLNQFARAASSAAQRAAGADSHGPAAKTGDSSDSRTANSPDPAAKGSTASADSAATSPRPDPGNLAAFYKALMDPEKVSYPQPARKWTSSDSFFLIVDAKLNEAGELAVTLDSATPQQRPPVTRDELENKVKGDLLRQAQALASSLFKTTGIVKSMNILNAAAVVTQQG